MASSDLHCSGSTLFAKVGVVVNSRIRVKKKTIKPQKKEEEEKKKHEVTEVTSLLEKWKSVKLRHFPKMLEVWKKKRK